MLALVLALVYILSDKKTRSGISVNKQPASKEEKSMRDLKAIFVQQIWLKWDHFIQLIKMFNYLLCVIDVFTKCAWVKSLKDKSGKAVLNAFIEIVNESNCKPDELWVDQRREFYNKLMQEWLDNNDILIYSTHNEGKSVIAEKFIKTLKI